MFKVILHIRGTNMFYYEYINTQDELIRVETKKLHLNLRSFDKEFKDRRQDKIVMLYENPINRPTQRSDYKNPPTHWATHIPGINYKLYSTESSSIKPDDTRRLKLKALFIEDV